MAMTLHSSPASPYAAKVRAVIFEKGLDEKINILASNPMTGENSLYIINPLARIPALVLENGEVLFDSPVICEYLDWLDGKPDFHPSPGPARWNALRWQAVGDGLMDTLFRWRQEIIRPENEQSPSFRQRNADITRMTLDAVERQIGTIEGFHIGAIALAMALGYLELRFADFDSRKDHPQLTQWLKEMKNRRSIAACLPRA